MIRQRIGIVLQDGGAGGGSERIACRLGQAWRREGRDVVLLCGDPAGAATWNGADPLKLLSPDPPIRRGRGSRARLGRWIAAEARRSDLQALYIPGNHHLPILSALRRRPGAGGLTVLAVLSNPIRRRDRSAVRQWLWERRLGRWLRLADDVVALSEPLAREAAVLVPAGRLHVVPLPALEDDRAISDAPAVDAPPVLIGVGRLVPQKNWPLLLRALTLTAPDVRLLLVGEGPDRRALEELADSLKLRDRVTFVGAVPDVHEWFARARLLVIASDYETGPAVLYEALAAGLPVVTTGCAPGMARRLPQEQVAVMPVGDAEALAAAITVSLARSPRPVGKEVLAPYRMGAVARRYLELMDARA